jgi:hypothetical protein
VEKARWPIVTRSNPKPPKKRRKPMRKPLRLVAIATALVAAVAFPAMANAAAPHFKHGGEPSCTISGTANSKTTSCSASLAGLGNADVKVTLTTSGSAVYQCQNKGGNIAPGQNRVLVGPSVTPVVFPADQIKNGNLSFTLSNTLTAPATVTAAEAGCPSANWTGVNPVLTVTDVSLVIEQPVGTVIFTCTASNPNGLSGTFALTCV